MDTETWGFVQLPPARFYDHERKPADRFRSFTYEELTKRDKLNLDMLTPSFPNSVGLSVCPSVSLVFPRVSSGSGTIRLRQRFGMTKSFEDSAS
jgi:hypothetical protein